LCCHTFISIRRINFSLIDWIAVEMVAPELNPMWGDYSIII